MRMRSPAEKCSRSAVVRSMTTSPADLGGVPLVIRNGLSLGSCSHANPRAGGPCSPAALPSLPMISAGPETAPSAVPTPSTPRIVASSGAGTGWRSLSETDLTPRTSTETPFLAVAKTPSKALLIVSPSTSAPTTKPTPRTTASDVRTSRSLFASRFRTA